MRSADLRVLRAAVALLLAPVVAVLAAGPAAAEPCAGDRGVTVVVDPGPLGGAPEVGCAQVPAASTAAAAVAAAGVEVTYTPGQPFVCRLDGRPTAADEDCVGTPPGDAYWGLFWASSADGPWTYATHGAAGLTVPSGGAVGWRFQDGGRREEPALDPAGRAGAGPAPARVDRDEAPGAPRPGAEQSGMSYLVAAGAAAGLLAAAVRLRRRRP